MAVAQRPQHVGIPASPLLKALVPYLDGLHDHAALATRLATAFENGTLRVPGIPPNPSSGSLPQPAALAETQVEQALRHLAQQAVLQA